ncbi:MAG: glycosyltransferase [Muribaculaceae bacterium]|nr:glycosyltransferase [Muribaculaceae bacterium]
MNIIHLVSNKEWGGGERYALDLCKALKADGHNVKALTRRRPEVAGPFIEAGLHGGYMRLGGVLDVLSPIKLARMLEEIDGNVILHVHNFKDAHTALNARRLYKGPHGIKVVCTRHLARPAKSDKSHLKILRELDAIIFVSHAALDTFRSTLPEDFDRSHLHVVHNSIASAPETETTVRNEPPTLVYLGRINPEKGLDVLLRALGDITDLDWKMKIYGTGPARDVTPLLKLCRALDLDSRVDWEGHTDKVFSALAGATALVLPSIVPEAFGLVILEAFSQGCPVVTTNNGAQPEIVTDGVDGFLVPPGDATALAAAMRKVLDARNNTGMRTAALEKFNNHFTYSRFYNDITAIYHGL